MSVSKLDDLKLRQTLQSEARPRSGVINLEQTSIASIRRSRSVLGITSGVLARVGDHDGDGTDDG